MNNTHKVILKVLILIILPTLVVAVWSKPTRNKVKPPNPAPVVVPPSPAVVLPYFSDLDLVEENLWTVDNSGSLLRFSVEGPELMLDVDRFSTGMNISFIDPMNGWAYASGYPASRLWRTTDGGKSWEKVSEGTAPESLISGSRRLKFFNKKQGWLADGFEIWRTVDGGENWTAAFSTGHPARRINSVVFIDARTVIVTQSDHRAAFTSDAGKTWRTSRAAGLYLLAENQRVAWAVGFDNMVFRSVDNGRTWVELSRIHSGAKMLSLQFINKLEGWATGVLSDQVHAEDDLRGAGVLFGTKDGGKTWEELTVPIDISFTRVAFLNSKIGWLMGHNALYQTKDGGATWIHVIERPSQL